MRSVISSVVTRKWESGDFFGGYTDVEGHTDLPVEALPADLDKHALTLLTYEGVLLAYQNACENLDEDHPVFDHMETVIPLLLRVKALVTSSTHRILSDMLLPSGSSDDNQVGYFDLRYRVRRLANCWVNWQSHKNSPDFGIAYEQYVERQLTMLKICLERRLFLAQCYGKDGENMVAMLRKCVDYIGRLQRAHDDGKWGRDAHGVERKQGGACSATIGQLLTKMNEIEKDAVAWTGMWQLDAPFAMELYAFLWSACADADADDLLHEEHAGVISIIFNVLAPHVYQLDINSHHLLFLQGMWGVVAVGDDDDFMSDESSEAESDAPNDNEGLMGTQTWAKEASNKLRKRGVMSLDPGALGILSTLSLPKKFEEVLVNAEMPIPKRCPWFDDAEGKEWYDALHDELSWRRITTRVFRDEVIASLCDYRRFYEPDTLKSGIQFWYSLEKLVGPSSRDLPPGQTKLLQKDPLKATYDAWLHNLAHFFIYSSGAALARNLIRGCSVKEFGPIRDSLISIKEELPVEEMYAPAWSSFGLPPGEHEQLFNTEAIREICRMMSRIANAWPAGPLPPDAGSLLRVCTGVDRYTAAFMHNGQGTNLAEILVPKVQPALTYALKEIDENVLKQCMSLGTHGGTSWQPSGVGTQYSGGVRHTDAVVDFWTFLGNAFDACVHLQVPVAIFLPAFLTFLSKCIKAYCSAARRGVDMTDSENFPIGSKAAESWNVFMQEVPDTLLDGEMS